MESFLKYGLKKLESMVNAMAILMKFSLGLGAIILAIYFYKIKYVPVDLTLGDGLVYVVISVKIFFTILLFIIFHFMVGKTLLTIKEFLFPPCNKKKVNKKPCTLTRVFKCLRYKKFSALRIFLRSSTDKLQYIFMYLLGLLISIPIGLVFYSELHIFIILNLIICTLLSTKIILEIIKLLRNKETDEILENSEKNKQLLLQFSILFIGLPILYVLVYENFGSRNVFIDGASQVVIEKSPKSVVYIKKSYITILDPNLVKISTPIQEKNRDELLEVKGLTVLLRGIGKNALVAYRNKNHKQRIEIPNDALFIKYLDEEPKEEKKK